MKKWSKKFGITITVLGIAAIGVGSSMAYFTSTDQVINRFTVGDQEVDLQEPEWDPEEGDGQNMYPGYTVYKNPTIKNVASEQNGEEPSYARMIITFQDDQGNRITDSEAIALIRQTIRYDSTYSGGFDKKGQGTLLTEGRIPGYSLKDLEKIPMINPEFVLDTKRSSENRLVYNYMGPEDDGILDIGEEAALFTDIVIPTDWNQTHMKKVGNFVIDIAQESIQAKGFSSQKDAFLALDSEIEAGTVQN